LTFTGVKVDLVRYVRESIIRRHRSSPLPTKIWCCARELWLKFAVHKLQNRCGTNMKHAHRKTAA